MVRTIPSPHAPAADAGYHGKFRSPPARKPETVVPRVRFGRNSYRNLVSCCIECNSRKGDRPARDFLRILYRKGRLTSAELDAGLRKLQALAAGKLRPSPYFENRK